MEAALEMSYGAQDRSVYRQGMLAEVLSTNRLGDMTKMTGQSHGNDSGCALKAHCGKGCYRLTLVTACREGPQESELL